MTGTPQNAALQRLLEPLIAQLQQASDDPACEALCQALQGLVDAIAQDRLAEHLAANGDSLKQALAAEGSPQLDAAKQQLGQIGAMLSFD